MYIQTSWVGASLKALGWTGAKLSLFTWLIVMLVMTLSCCVTERKVL